MLDLHTSCWLQIARSETLPQPTGTTSKQRSGSQPKTRRESVAPLYTQLPSRLNNKPLKPQVRGHAPAARCLTCCRQTIILPDWGRVALQRADHGKFLQIPQLDGPEHNTLQTRPPEQRSRVKKDSYLSALPDASRYSLG